MMSVREEAASDAEKIFELLSRSFGRPKEAELVNALRGDAAFIPMLSLVAENEGEIVGYLLFTKIAMDNHPAVKIVAMGPLAVRPDAQGLGVGSTLAKTGLEKAAALGFDGVLVLGSKDYYSRFGFRLASEWGITTAYDDPDSTLVLELHPNALQNVSGVARYSDEFARHDC